MPSNTVSTLSPAASGNCRVNDPVMTISPAFRLRPNWPSLPASQTSEFSGLPNTASPVPDPTSAPFTKTRAVTWVKSGGKATPSPALQGRFRLTLRKDLRLDYPRAETPTHYMTMAMDPDLDQCVVRALRDMIVLLGEKRNLSREDAYTLCSLAANLRVTQTVNGSKGIHCMIAKDVVHG